MPVPLVAAGSALNIVKRVPLVGGLLTGSSTPQALTTHAAWEQEVLAGNQHSLDLLVTAAGWNCGQGIAATEAAKNDAKQRVAKLLQSGAITGPTGNGDYGMPTGVPCLVGSYRIADARGTAASPGSGVTLSGLGVTGAAMPGWVLLVVGVLILLALPRLFAGR